MINFRYHLVSVTAVFLALAIGLVLGTTALNGPTMDWLSESVSSLRKDNEQLRDKVGQLEEDATDKQEFAAKVAPTTLKNTLKDERVVVLAVGGADPKQVEGVMTMLGYSEADNAGQLSFSDEFIAPDNDDKLIDLAAELTPEDFEPPNNNDGMETVSALLAASMLTDNDVSADDRDKVVEGLTDLDMVSQEKKLSSKKATAALIVTGEPYTDADSSERNEAMVTFADQFGQAGATVLASPNANEDASPVSAVREDATLAKRVSTIDNALGPEGQMTAVLALPERIDGSVGHYGTGDDAKSLVPEDS